MPASPQQDNLIQEIKLFLRYAVPENEFMEAAALVDRYRNDRRVLSMLRQYYTDLPEAREEAVVKITRLLHRQGVFLFVLTTTSTAHFYAVSLEEAVWLGEYPRGIDPESLSFWGVADEKEFSGLCVSTGDLEEYAPIGKRTEAECPVCGVEEGEYHLFGCMVEICPWCEGQLNRCNCRFEQLENDVIDSEEQVEQFFELLLGKGRIPHRRDQAPAYPGTSEGLDRKNT